MYFDTRVALGGALGGRANTMQAETFSLRHRQLAAIGRMLSLERDEDEHRSAWHDPWKVLVYDAFCRDVISPLLKVGDLRKRGVTLHLLLDLLGCFGQLDELAKASKEAAVTENFACLAKEK